MEISESSRDGSRQSDGTSKCRGKGYLDFWGRAAAQAPVSRDSHPAWRYTPFPCPTFLLSSNNCHPTTACKMCNLVWRRWVGLSFPVLMLLHIAQQHVSQWDSLVGFQVEYDDAACLLQVQAQAEHFGLRLASFLLKEKKAHRRRTSDHLQRVYTVQLFHT